MKLIQAKTILAYNRANIYRGCSHGCIYCDTRSKCYQVAHYDEIEVKINAIEVLEKELSKKRKRVVITTGSMCDPYMHIEQELKLTRQMLELIERKGLGVGVLTKSDLALRDIDLFTKINENYKAVVCYTITTFDDDLCLKLEPNVAPSSVRFECLRQFSEHGILTGLWLSPVLPFITDTAENIINIVNKAAAVGVKYILAYGIGTTMREGSREYFYNELDKLFPGLKSKYQAQYGNSYICLTPNHRQLYKVLATQCEKHNILYKIEDINNLLKNHRETTQLTLF